MGTRTAAVLLTLGLSLTGPAAWADEPDPTASPLPESCVYQDTPTDDGGDSTTGTSGDDTGGEPGDGTTGDGTTGDGGTEPDPTTGGDPGATTGDDSTTGTTGEEPPAEEQPPAEEEQPAEEEPTDDSDVVCALPGEVYTADSSTEGGGSTGGAGGTGGGGGTQVLENAVQKGSALELPATGNGRVEGLLALGSALVVLGCAALVAARSRRTGLAP